MRQTCRHVGASPSRGVSEREAAEAERFFEELNGGSSPPPFRRDRRGPMPRMSPVPRRPWSPEMESFATGAAARVSTLQLRTTLATIAESERERWRAGTTVLVEGDTWARSILRNDYWTSIGIPDPATHFASATWWSTAAWSAAFIMACARKAQAALQLPNPVLGHPTLTENTFHSAYCWQAFRDRTAGLRERYWAYQPADALVEVGDIVAKTRGAVTVAQAWAATTAAAYGSFTSHADIVVRVDGLNARVIGGNVSNSVGRNTYGLTATGRIDTAVAANDANRVFAVLKPEGAAFSGRLMGMVV